MKLKTSYAVEVEKDRAYFDYLKLEMLDGGMLVQARSPLFHAYFRKTSGGITLTTTDVHRVWRAGTYYLPSGDFPHYDIPCVLSWNDPNYFNDTRPNLLWLCHTKLGEGFELVVPSPIALNSWEDYCHQTGEVIQTIYLKLLRRATYEATFSEVWKGEEL